MGLSFLREVPWGQHSSCRHTGTKHPHTSSSSTCTRHPWADRRWPTQHGKKHRAAVQVCLPLIRGTVVTAPGPAQGKAHRGLNTLCAGDSPLPRAWSSTGREVGEAQPWITQPWAPHPMVPGTKLLSASTSSQGSRMHMPQGLCTTTGKPGPDRHKHI